jgi:hypothetical protein
MLEEATVLVVFDEDGLLVLTGCGRPLSAYGAVLDKHVNNR